MLYPILWAFWVAASGPPEFRWWLIFGIGIFLTRSAGCILNDFADRKFDPHVERTQFRPLATGLIQPLPALMFAAVLYVLAASLLLFLNPLCWLLAIVGFVLTAIYPWMKRFTYYPQVILGLTYNLGVLMAFAAIAHHLSWQAWFLYFLAALWQVMYDTEYAMADLHFDQKMGIKSTAIAFGQSRVWILAALQMAFVLGVIAFGFLQQYSMLFYLAALGCIPLFAYQSWRLQNPSLENCLWAFNHNHWVGLVVWLGFLYQCHL